MPGIADLMVPVPPEQAPAAPGGNWKQRVADLQSQGVGPEEALITAAEEGLIHPKMAEGMLKSMTRVQALGAEDKPPPEPSRVFQPSGPASQGTLQPPRVFPPSGPAPKQIDPSILAALMQAKGGR
jgi:hypothetical protein